MAKKQPTPGRRWKRVAQPPSEGVEVSTAALCSAIAAGQLEFTQAELMQFGVEGVLDWKSFVRTDSGLFQPARPPKRDPLALVVAFAVFVLLAICGFIWTLWKMGVHSYEFFADVDIASPGGAAVAIGSAALAAATLYYVFFPEGQARAPPARTRAPAALASRGRAMHYAARARRCRRPGRSARDTAERRDEAGEGRGTKARICASRCTQNQSVGLWHGP